MKKIKPVIQHDLKDCGVCCMEWIINYYDGFIPLEKLREDTLTDNTGTSAYHLVEAFKKWGFDSMGVLELDLNSNRLNYPLIAHLKLENGLEHFVVLKEIIHNTIYVMDPGSGDIKYDKTTFNKLFTGHIIIAYPRDKIIKMNKGLTITKLFLKIINKEKNLIIKIIVTSILFNILIIISSYYLKIGSELINNDIAIIKYLIIVFGFITIIKISLSYIRDYYTNHLSNLVDVYIYPVFIKHLFFLPLKSIKNRTIGEITTRVNELGNIKSLFSDIFITGFLESIMLLISIVILYFINQRLFLILLIIIIIYLIYGTIISKIIYHKILENINYQTDFNSMINESVAMFETIKNLNVFKIILEKIEFCLAKYLLNNYRFGDFFNKSNLGKDFLLEISFYLINSYGLLLVIQNKLNIIDLFTFNIIISYAIDPVKNIINLLPKYNYVKATFNKISEFINLEEEKLLEPISNILGDIIFYDVSYSYNNYHNTLNNCNFSIKNGSHVFLKGNSGSGKSTICKLLYKELDNYKGNIMIGNSNIKDLSLSTIRNNILYVSQNEEIFQGSIKDNILFGREVDDKYLEDISRICKIDEIVSKKGMRYESIIESTSKNISGGERERIILARGLLKPAKIIILDEALSEVDFKLEEEIIKNIREYFHDKTIIYISHKNQAHNFSNIIEVNNES